MQPHYLTELLGIQGYRLSALEQIEDVLGHSMIRIPLGAYAHNDRISSH